jgi:hypothetical protein
MRRRRVVASPAVRLDDAAVAGGWFAKAVVATVPVLSLAGRDARGETIPRLRPDSRHGTLCLCEVLVRPPDPLSTKAILAGNPALTGASNLAAFVLAGRTQSHGPGCWVPTSELAILKASSAPLIALLLFGVSDLLLRL